MQNAPSCPLPFISRARISHKSTAEVEKTETNREIKDRERQNSEGDAARCNERDRLASKQTNCNKAYSLLKIDEE